MTSLSDKIHEMAPLVIVLIEPEHSEPFEHPELKHDQTSSNVELQTSQKYRTPNTVRSNKISLTLKFAAFSNGFVRIRLKQIWISYISPYFWRVRII